MAEGEVEEEGPWFPCAVSEHDDDTVIGGAGAPFYPKRLWGKKRLKVAFMNKMMPWRLTSKTSLYEELITTAMILEWANVWSSRKLNLQGKVPEFVFTSELDDSDIRVKFSKDCGSWSRIGTNAESYQGECTLVLNLSSRDDDYRQYVVVHEFGHALGLGHEHQMTQIAKALDVDKVIEMLQSTGLSKKDAGKKFKADYHYYSKSARPKKGIQFDPWSIMCYPIPLECIKDRSRFSREELAMITTRSYDKRKSLSDIDITTITNMYGKPLAGSGPLAPLSVSQEEQEEEEEDEEEEEEEDGREEKAVIATPVSGGTNGKQAGASASNRQDERPDLPDLTSFKMESGEKMNIAAEIPPDKSQDICIQLLNDRRGNKYQAIERGRVVGTEVNTEILRKWVSEMPRKERTWRRLIEVLKNNGCVSLAEDIEDVVGEC